MRRRRSRRRQAAVAPLLRGALAILLACAVGFIVLRALEQPRPVADSRRFGEQVRRGATEQLNFDGSVRTTFDPPGAPQADTVVSSAPLGPETRQPSEGESARTAVSNGDPAAPVPVADKAPQAERKAETRPAVREKKKRQAAARRPPEPAAAPKAAAKPVAPKEPEQQESEPDPQADDSDFSVRWNRADK